MKILGRQKFVLRRICFNIIQFLSTAADRQGVDISFTVCVFVCFVRLRICSTEDKASGVKFCTAVHRRPRQEIFHFGELCSPKTQNRTNRPARPCCNVMLLGFCDSHAYQVRSACGRRIVSHMRTIYFALYKCTHYYYYKYKNCRFVTTCKAHN